MILFKCPILMINSQLEKMSDCLFDIIQKFRFFGNEETIYLFLWPRSEHPMNSILSSIAFEKLCRCLDLISSTMYERKY